ncbi:MAG: response regulator [Ardenticatenaceae bacterium]|nr:response regulator [Anaerolineales bacterium]MCB8982880.1 response regulator [Ardenticatenaceae bacterium]MCB8986338.1 response regulator [Ardenticatenaceae bacterium]
MTFKLLIVDDHPETRSIIGRVLEQQGYQVVTAVNGAEGLKLAEQEKPDLILLDFMMPVMDGRETCQRLRQRPEMAKVPIMMFTAVDDPQQKLSVFDAGADDYINKPTEPTELVDRVKTLLKTAYGPLPETGSHDETRLQQATDAPTFLESTTSRPGADQLIAVLGARGGAGTTTVAINLAAVYASLGQPTTLIDLDMTQGHIGLYLNQKNAGGLNMLATLPEEDFGEHLPGTFVSYSHNLRLLLSQVNQNRRFARLSGLQTAVLLDTLSASNQTIIVDLGTDLNEISRAALERADQIIVCLRPERIALSAARYLLNSLKDGLFPLTELHALMIDFGPQGTQLPRTAVESFLGHPLLATISILPAEMTRAVNKAQPLVHLSAQTQSGNYLRQLAQQLVKT